METRNAKEVIGLVVYGRLAFLQKQGRRIRVSISAMDTDFLVQIGREEMARKSAAGSTLGRVESLGTLVPFLGTCGEAMAPPIPLPGGTRDSQSRQDISLF